MLQALVVTGDSSVIRASVNDHTVLLKSKFSLSPDIVTFF